MLHASRENPRALPTDLKINRKSRKDRTLRRVSEFRRGITLKQCDALIKDYLQALGSPRALSTWLLYESGEHSQLVKQTIDPHDYIDSTLFRKDYASVKFLSKCKGLTTGIDTEKVAIEAAHRAEEICRKTNQRLRDLYNLSPLEIAKTLSVLEKASKRIEQILGPLPNLTYEGMDNWDPGFSPGRTTSASGDLLASIYKYASRLDTTTSASERALHLVRSSPIWGASALNADGPTSVLRNALTLVPGNVMIVVPKNAKTGRVICYEPHLNVRLQLGIGKLIRRRLLRNARVNLNDQSINQRRVRFQTQSGTIATIDLSMASDTLAFELVRILFSMSPVLLDWFHVLDSCRSKYTLWPDAVNSEYTKNEKFSSMGNGFTFELESLIFYALASVTTDSVSVFGDDIIVPVNAFESVKESLELAGFILNPDKSFATSLFRESCGTDMFGYRDCTPVYLRTLPKRTEDVVKLHNQIRAFVARDSAGSYRISFENETAEMLTKWRNIHTALLGPEGFGDGHYHVNLDEANPHRASFFIDAWCYMTVATRYPLSRLYGDRVFGAIPDRYQYSALCAGTGPKRSTRLIESTADRRQTVHSVTRALANVWPEIVWA